MPDDWAARPFSILGHIFNHYLLPEGPAEEAAFKRDLGFDAEY